MKKLNLVLLFAIFGLQAGDAEPAEFTREDAAIILCSLSKSVATAEKSKRFFICDQCEYRCVREHYLKKHIKKTHPKNTDVNQKPLLQKGIFQGYICNQCDYFSTREHYLKKHIEKAHTEK